MSTALQNIERAKGAAKERREIVASIRKWTCMYPNDLILNSILRELIARGKKEALHYGAGHGAVQCNEAPVAGRAGALHWYCNGCGNTFPHKRRHCPACKCQDIRPKRGKSMTPEAKPTPEPIRAAFERALETVETAHRNGLTAQFMDGVRYALGWVLGEYDEDPTE